MPQHSVRAKSTIGGYEPGLSRNINGREPELSGLRAQALLLNQPLILHSDDEPSILTLMRIIMERGGYRVETTLEGHRALELAEELRPDLIITDIMKPHMSGLELLACLKADPALRHIPVIILSAHATQQSSKDAYALGAAAYVTKPCTPDDFIQVISNMLDGGERWAAWMGHRSPRP